MTTPIDNIFLYPDVPDTDQAAAIAFVLHGTEKLSKESRNDNPSEINCKLAAVPGAAITKNVYYLIEFNRPHSANSQTKCKFRVKCTRTPGKIFNSFKFKAG